MEFKRLILALSQKKKRKPLDPYSSAGFPPRDRQRHRFREWRKKRKESQLHKALAKSVTDPRTLCACGAIKLLAESMCFECKDMWKIIRQKITPQTVRGDVAERYALPVLSTYDAFGHDRRFRKHIDDGDPAQENALRILEDG